MYMKIGKSNSNQGYSLIELVVVIAIMGICVGVTLLSVGVVTRRKAVKCAEELVTSLESVRVRTLGKEQNAVECIVSKDAEGNCVVSVLQNGTEVSNRRIGDKSVELKVYFDKEATGYDLNSIEGSGQAGSTGAGLHVVINRSSGAFVEKTNVVSGAVKDYCTKIEIVSGSKTVEVSLVGKTGKIVTN